MRIQGLAGIALAMVLLSGCGVSSRPTVTTTPTAVASSVFAVVTTVPDAAALQAAGLELCPLMWDHYKEITAVFNRASSEVGSLATAADRRARWMAALDEMATDDTRLAEDLATIDDPLMRPVVEDIRSGIDQSLAEIDDIRQLFVSMPEIDDEAPQARTQQVVVRVEKVIDVVKPEMASYAIPGLIEAWRSIPACQFGVKDVDDGTPRANG